MTTVPGAFLGDGHRRVLVSGGGVTMFAESGGFGVRRHRQPVWKVVLPVGGHVEAGVHGRMPVAAAGVIVPPHLPHTCAATSSYVALFIDPWLLRPGAGVVPLGEAEVRRVLAALGRPGAPDLDAARAEVTALVGAGRVPDPRVVHALGQLTCPGPIAAIAADVGLSAPRLRALVRESVGTPLVRLRQWARLRAAVAALPGASVATAAADAGFADQAHFARTARDLIGRTPASLASRLTTCPNGRQP
ncbi:helix-turn-helix domain-containing protein [Nonomuraea sp. NPDC005983]|uniref:helix-turn-helix domain-containing protein n=1 Tax=Nonomuraea sp. NPDC005983 TaxID=3155595 RepID=UPI0033BC03B6